MTKLRYMYILLVSIYVVIITFIILHPIAFRIDISTGLLNFSVGKLTTICCNSDCSEMMQIMYYKYEFGFQFSLHKFIAFTYSFVDTDYSVIC